MNPTKAKSIATQLINIASHYNREQKKSIDYQQLVSLEIKLNMADPTDLKDAIIPVLEAQMTKGNDKLSILRYMCLFSTT